MVVAEVSSADTLCVGMSGDVQWEVNQLLAPEADPLIPAVDLPPQGHVSNVNVVVSNPQALKETMIQGHKAMCLELIRRYYGEHPFEVVHFT